MVYKRKTVAELKELLSHLLKGTYLKKAVSVTKSYAQRRREFLLLFKLKPLARRYFFIFFKLNSSFFGFKLSRVLLRSSRVKKVRCFNKFYLNYLFLVFKNIFKYINIEEVNKFNAKQLYRYFILKYIKFDLKLFFPFFFSSISEFSLSALKPSLGSKIFYRSIFFFSKKKFFNFRKFFDVLIIKHNFFNNFKMLKKNYNIYECFITLNKNNIFFIFFRLIDGKVVYSISTGMIGFNGKKKKTPLAADYTARKFAEVVVSRLTLSKVFFDDLQVNLSLFGPISSLVVKEACKGLYKGGLRFNKIIDKVAIEHSSGITRKKPRRV